MNIRAKCVKNKWNEHGRDPELTKGKFYKVTDDHIFIMGADAALSLVGDHGDEITRPKHIFKIFKR